MKKTATILIIFVGIIFLTGCSINEDNSTKNLQNSNETDKDIESQPIEKKNVKEKEIKPTDINSNNDIDKDNEKLNQDNVNVEWGNYYKSTYNMKDDWMMDINITNNDKNIITYKLEVTPDRGYDFITDLGRIQGLNSDITWDRIYHFYEGETAKFGNYKITLSVYECGKLPKNIQDEICVMKHIDLEEIFDKYKEDNDQIESTSTYTKFYNIFSIEKPPVEISEKQYLVKPMNTNIDNEKEEKFKNGTNNKAVFNSIVFDRESYTVDSKARANINIKNSGEKFNGLILIKMNREGFSSKLDGEYIYSNYYKFLIENGASLNNPVAFSFSNNGTSWPSESSVFENKGKHNYEFSLYDCDDIKKEFNKECDEVEFGEGTFDDGLPKIIPLDTMSISIDVE